MSYSVDQLVIQFRTQMDDNAEPYLWDEDRIVEWIDEAQKIFAEKTKIFKGSESITVLTVDGGDFAIPSYVLEVRRAIMASQSQPLEVGNFNAIDRNSVYSDYGIDLNGDWETISGSPRLLVLDEKDGFGRVVPKLSINDSYNIASVTTTTVVVGTAINTARTPATGIVVINSTSYAYTGISGSTFTGITPDPTGETGSLTVDGFDTIKMHYYRYPLKDVTSSSSKIELTDTRHQRLMVVYARAMAYGDHDADVYDPKQEAAKLDEFHTKVDTITAQISRQTRRAGTVKYGGL